MTTRFAASVLLVVSTCPPGCLVLKQDHEALAARVAELERAQADQARTLKATLDKADELAQVLEGKLKEAEALLRRNQADLGLRVETLEFAVETLRGLVENAEFVAKASGQELTEMRRELDARLTKLEERLNEATNIPETPDALWSEAKRREAAGKHASARKLWRIYLARYPKDPKIPQAAFAVGRTYFAEGDYRAALGEFYRLIQEHPSSSVIPDALYYSGLSFARLGQCKNAIAYFEALDRPNVQAPEKYKKAAKKQIRRLSEDKGRICTDREDAAAGAAGRQGSKAAEDAGGT